MRNGNSHSSADANRMVWSALLECAEDFAEQCSEEGERIDWTLRKSKRLKGVAAATEYRLLFENLLDFIRSDQPDFQLSELTFEYTEDKVGSILFRQAATAYANAHGMDLRKAKTLLSRAVVINSEGRSLLSQLEKGELSIADAESAITALLSIKMPIVEPEYEKSEGLEELKSKIREAREAMGEEMSQAVADGAQGMEFSRLSKRLREKHHPVSFEERAKKARQRRNVTIKPCSDGMAMIQGYVPSQVAVTLERVFAVLVRRMIADGSSEGRTRNQLMADIFTDLLQKNPFFVEALTSKESAHVSLKEDGAGNTQDTGGEMVVFPEGVGAHVVINVTLTEFLQLGGVVDEELESKLIFLSPELRKHVTENRIIATQTSKKRRESIRKRKLQDEVRVVGSEHALSASDAAEYIAHMSMLSLILSDHVTGYPVGVGRKTYRANERLRLLTALRDQHCRAPGCRRPYFESEHDHTLTWADEEGGTDYGNLAWFCKEHHTAKTAGWLNVASRPDLGDGVLEFTSPQFEGKQTTFPQNPVHPEIWKFHREYLEASKEPPF